MLKFLTFLALYLPFQIALNPGKGIDLASIRVLILGIFLVWLAKGLKARNIRIGSNWVTGLIATFLFLNSISVLVARNTDWSVRKLLFLFSIFPVYLVAQAIINDRDKAKKISQALLFGGSIVSVMGLVQFFSQFLFGLERIYKFWAENVIVVFLGKTFSQAVLENPSWLVNIGGQTFLRATATFPDPHMLSFFLGLLIPVALAFFLTEEKKGRYGAALALILVCDLATFSRGGYLGIFAGVVFLTAYFWKRIGKSSKFAVVGILTIFLIGLLVPNPVSRRYLSIFDLREGSNKGRIETWSQAVEIVGINPIIGTGIGNYSLEIKPTAGYREPIYAHNTYLDIAAETGIFNALVWAGILIAAIRSFLKISKKDLFFGAFAASLVIFSVHSLVETAIYSPVVLTLFLLILSFSGLEKSEKNHYPA